MGGGSGWKLPILVSFETKNVHTLMFKHTFHFQAQWFKRLRKRIKKNIVVLSGERVKMCHVVYKCAAGAWRVKSGSFSTCYISNPFSAGTVFIRQDLTSVFIRQNLTSVFIRQNLTTVFIRQNLTSVDVRIWRIKTVPALKELKYF